MLGVNTTSASRPSFVSDEMIAVAASVVNACQTQTGVATADIEAVRNGEWPESRPLKCYMYCLWEQFGLVDDKRELSLNGMLTFFQRIPAYRAEVQRAIRECKGIEKNIHSIDFIQQHMEITAHTHILSTCVMQNYLQRPTIYFKIKNLSL
ncbi:hypothetical protein PV326_009916 [Microctonus aethiopoides]|nr:hypothetical protein PV326_009916 [Microctonus aethiopoides]